MEEEATIDPSLLEAASASASAKAAGDPYHGWQKVTYAKRQRRPQPPPANDRSNEVPDRSHVFASLEQKALERRRAIESDSTVTEATAARSTPATAASDVGDDDSGAEAPPGAHEKGTEAAKKVKQKKPKVTVAEAAANIDAEDLGVFLVEISASYESQQNIQLMRFADYFARSFASVSASQFPWVKMFKESPVNKIADVPLCHVSDSIYKISADWIAEKSPECVGDFILWCLDGIISDMASQQATVKGSKRHVPQAPSKAQVAIFVVLAMALRRKPDILISLLPKIRDNPKYQGQEKLPIIVWAIAQSSQGDTVIGMYLWAHYLLPMVCGKSSVNPQSRDLVLQLVERLLSGPKARPILLNGAVRKGERLIPPVALDLLMRNAFPASTARVKATERFEAIYPTLKELALAGSPGTKTTKQASQQLLPLTIQAIQESNSELTKEATDIFIWCLIQNAECYRQWEKLHLENVDASVAVLRKLTNEWKDYADKISLGTLRETINHLRAKNEEALSGDVGISKQASIKDADKYCKVVLRKSASRSCFTKFGVVLMLMIAICFSLFPNMKLLAWKKLNSVFQFQ
ncbi:unnamed protein product [Musa acuminata subsp. malaccensis]|uniref:(wild Malaysian banana) hypothetical protein n=1 Tax=Musa acuminata subsp. malaccensis TaxID=214687 RepID=A0A804JUV1_MUSAM|nr:PREDICTED: uncharacterized protein LOC103991450 isoform X1 [Musa acuminata subsp. malaccensis]CAG1856325.1 unnamed protein product [Musa acuminata subsp. malaccensis]